MNELAKEIRDKILRTEKEMTTAQNKAEEYRRKVSEQEQKLVELQSGLRFLQNWLDEIGGGDKVIAGSYKRTATITGKALVRDFIAAAEREFTGAQLIEAIQKVSPEANPNSIRGDLSRLKSEGLVERVGTDIYRPIRNGSAISPIRVTEAEMFSLGPPQDNRKPTTADYDAAEQEYLSNREQT